MEKERLLLTTHLSAGDIITMTAAVRDLHRAHPGKFLVNADTNVGEVWDNNPYLDRSITKSNADRVIEMHYTGAINKCNQDKSTHFINGYIEHLAGELGIDIPLTEFKPDLHFSTAELNTPVSPLEAEGKPYWVMFAGGKTDYTAKWWHHKKFEAVAEALKDQVTFVQVGASGGDKWNPRIPGTVSMIGKTTFRSLCRLILGSHGVLCPVTCGLHIAAAVNKPCITLSGGREGWWWEQYENQVYLHTIGGNLDCCKEFACWRSHVDIKYVGVTDNGKAMTDQERLSKVCLKVVDKDGQKQPLCMDAISVERVVEEVNHYQEEVDYVKPTDTPDFVQYQSGLEITDKVLTKRAAVCVCLYGNDGDAGEYPVPQVCNKAGDKFEHIPTMTYTMLHKRCISSILDNTDLSKINLYIGCNNVSEETLRWLSLAVGPELSKYGGTLIVHDETSNIRKYPIMKKMFAALGDEEWVLWFDDDSYVTNDKWLHRVMGAVNANPDVKTFGQIYKIRSIRGQWEWVQKASWYTGVQPECTKRRNGRQYPIYKFLTGGFQVIAREVLTKLQWPDERIGHNGGDVMFGEACRQNMFKMKDLFTEGNIGIVISGAQRRGLSEPPAGSHSNARRA